MRHFRITVEGRSYDVSVEELDETAPAAPPPGATSTPAPVIAAAPRTTPVPTPPPIPPATDALDESNIPSPLAGTVVSIDVTIGQHVTQGQQLVVLEAMKMNTYITAPRDGQIVAVKVTPGTAVAEGQALLAIG
ncbi:biotin/lipoyl-binding protein [Azoarcus sp. L1K30]|uniref:biotin/lipoyl-containing protein n=1 Tax=Azoarcus sp. L1K30 TaxID=2820277 RepID=UPI001B8319D2|nr:acetyl-CoA carboxylase biotin carboxyl carrier protein subunit [Azoarcus sp. L1K30]MBR0568280.1 biotin/lipoyl-binding protein [Azoarcus sp. L1K30]